MKTRLFLFAVVAPPALTCQTFLPNQPPRFEQKKRGPTSPPPTSREPRHSMRCRKRDLVERRVLRLELLHHRDALNEPRHDLLDLWIQFSIVGLRILLRLPQADCFQLPLFRCYEQQLV